MSTYASETHPWFPRIASSPALRAPRPRLAPGPTHDLLGTWLSLRRDPLRFLSDGTARYGSTFRFRLGSTLIHLLGDAESVKHVFQDHPAKFTKRWAYDKVRPVLGNGLLTSEGDHWRAQRRLIQPVFQPQRVAVFGAEITRITGELLDEWEPAFARGEPIDVAREMAALTLRIVGSTLFGVDVRRDTDGIGAAMSTLIEGANQRIMTPTSLFEQLPTRAGRAFAEAKAFLDRLAFRMIAERRRAPDLGHDLLSNLVRARDEAGRGMTDEQIRDEVLTLLLAGHETTANTLGWTFYLLSRNPLASRRLQDEVRRVLGERPPASDDVQGLVYTRMVLEESMRLYPPGWVLVRYVEEPAELAGYAVPAGSVVAVCPYLLHRDPRYWDNPEGFDPERFTDEASAGRPRFAWFPLSGGPRVCIGKAFAMMEMQIIVASVLQRFRLDLVPTHPVELDAQVTLRARDGIRMHLRRAGGAQGEAAAGARGVAATGEKASRPTCPHRISREDVR